MCSTPFGVKATLTGVVEVSSQVREGKRLRFAHVFLHGTTRNTSRRSSCGACRATHGAPDAYRRQTPNGADAEHEPIQR
ncbi:hypothetical protein CLOM_g23124 [Closterium sp. NIES-68]|nr:hypothetical protein CLOM_g23124 [Closterium sp. NIES-68]